jgi:hypothetical protein
MVCNAGCKRAYKSGGLFEGADRLECFSASPEVRCADYAAHFSCANVLGTAPRRNGEKSKKTIGNHRAPWESDPVHFIVRCFAQFMQHWTAVDHIDWVQRM